MDKYGVLEEGRDAVKVANSDTKTCPLCGRELKQYGPVVLCPEHGSRPFENDVEKK